MNRGDAAAATRIVREDASRRRRGYDVDGPRRRRRGRSAETTTWTVRGDERGDAAARPARARRYKAPPKGCWDDPALGDIAWDRAFAPCVSRAPDGRCRVDLGALHDLVRPEGAPPASHA